MPTGSCHGYLISSNICIHLLHNELRFIQSTDESVAPTRGIYRNVATATNM